MKANENFNNKPQKQQNAIKKFKESRRDTNATPYSRRWFKIRSALLNNNLNPRLERGALAKQRLLYVI